MNIATMQRVELFNLLAEKFDKLGKEYKELGKAYDLASDEDKPAIRAREIAVFNERVAIKAKADEMIAEKREADRLKAVKRQRPRALSAG